MKNVVLQFVIAMEGFLLISDGLYREMFFTISKKSVTIFYVVLKAEEES